MINIGKLIPLRTKSVSLIKISSSLFHNEYRVVSGIQPTGSIHLGNYFGAIQQWTNLQEPKYFESILSENRKESIDSRETVQPKLRPCYLQPIFQIVDLHSLTVSHQPDKLRRNILEITAVLLGCGIETNKSILFKQSAIPYHGYLCWILSTLTTISQLNRFPQFKEKSLYFQEPPTGLLLYPVLQTADILLYKGTHIPIGNDQLAHINIAKHLASKFNKIYGKEIFTIPTELIINDGRGRIKSLRDPSKKMSKSEISLKSRIELTDSSDMIVMKILKSVTDMKSEITFDPENRPGVSNLVLIYSLISGLQIEQVCDRFANKSTHEFKIEISEALVEYLKPIRSKIDHFKSNPEYLEKILNDGGSQATEIAERTIEEVKKVTGFK
ncbi:Centaurin-gamma [Sarcoptes scabiei]|nr:Centaurin-gamma [Sarcoptes scabiei]